MESPILKNQKVLQQTDRALELRIADKRCSPMPKVPWSNFVAARSTSYLVAAVAPIARGRPVRQQLGLLVALLGKLKLAKAYAATIDPQGQKEVLIAFEDEADARRFVEVVQAKSAASLDQAWARQWVFHMNEVTSDAIRAAIMTGCEPRLISDAR